MRRHIESKGTKFPFVWGNPQATHEWYEVLRGARSGVESDNEPLTWIKDLTEKDPQERPRAWELTSKIRDAESCAFIGQCCAKDDESDYNQSPPLSADSGEFGGLDLTEELASLDGKLDKKQSGSISGSSSQQSVDKWLDFSQSFIPNEPSQFTSNEISIPEIGSSQNEIHTDEGIEYDIEEDSDKKENDPNPQLSPRRTSRDQYSFRSSSSEPLTNNSRRIETVEQPIRRLILPEITTLKHEQNLKHNRPKLNGSLRRSFASGHGSGDLIRLVSRHASAPKVIFKPKVVLNRNENSPGLILSGKSVNERKESKDSRNADSPLELFERDMPEEMVIPIEESSQKTSEDGHISGRVSVGDLSALAQKACSDGPESFKLVDQEILSLLAVVKERGWRDIFRCIFACRSAVSSKNSWRRMSCSP